MGLRALGLLQGGYRPRAFHLGDAVALRIVHRLQEEPRAPALLAECAQAGTDRILDDVVTQDPAEQLLAGEVLARAEPLRDPARLVLQLVGEAAAEVLAR